MAAKLIKNMDLKFKKGMAVHPIHIFIFNF